jgi:hypothetical protein
MGRIIVCHLVSANKLILSSIFCSFSLWGLPLILAIHGEERKRDKKGPEGIASHGMLTMHVGALLLLFCI